MQPAQNFYPDVMRVTGCRSTVLRTIFAGASDWSRAAVHVDYKRTVGYGEPSTIEVVELFKLTEDRSKLAAVTLIYDTVPGQSEFNNLEADGR